MQKNQGKTNEAFLRFCIANGCTNGQAAHWQMNRAELIRHFPKNKYHLWEKCWTKLVETNNGDFCKTESNLKSCFDVKITQNEINYIKC